MRILVVTDWYPTGPSDPAGCFVRRQALALSGLHDVAVLHLGGARSGSARLRLDAEQDGPLYTLRLHRPPRLPVTAGNLAALVAALRRLRARGFEPDLLHAHEVGAGFASVAIGARRRPVVVTVHQATFGLGEVRGVTARLARAAFARADLVCPVSASLRERMEASGWPGRFHVVPNVVDTERFVPGPPPDGGVPRIVVVASLNPVKGVGDLVEAAGLLARRGLEFRIDLVGDGPLREPLERRIHELGLGERVALHGALPADGVAARMREASFAVVPSLWETFSVALSEAMASGLPIVATSVGGMVERVHDGNGLLVPAGDPARLAEGVAAMLERHRSYDRAAIAAEVRAEFAPATVAQLWDAIYQEVVGHRERP